MGTGAGALTLSLMQLNLACESSKAPDRSEEGGPQEPGFGEEQPAVGIPRYRSWEDLYREQWRWDKVVKGTHNRANCVSACPWNLYVRDGIVWREEQAAVMAASNSSLPDFNPRGCQKGACYSALMYGPARLRYPLKREGERGSGRWRRISWDEALGTVAEHIIDTCLVNGSECIVYDGGSTNVDFGPDTAAEMRFIGLLGSTILDSNGAAVGDAALGAVQTWGMGFVDGTADDWMHADVILVWCMNPNYTRIPDAHFLWEARYRGARLGVVAPDYNATAIHADLWLNPRVGTDAALALAMAQVIVSEKLYREDYIKEQTDLPFLVRADTGRFLRQTDVEKDGSDEVFYLWDTATGRLVHAPGTQGRSDRTIRLRGVDPALEGARLVTLRDGSAMTVQPVFELLKNTLSSYTPEEAEPITGINAVVIRRVARDVARARAATIIASFGACKHYHSDLLQRALILLLALTGNQGKKGGGLRVAAWWSMDGFETLASAYEPPYYLTLLARLFRPGVRTIETHLERLMREEYLFTPALLWLYVHGGLAEAGVQADIGESLRRRWMPVYPRPGQDPQVLICTGGNPLRRWPAPAVVERHLWPKLKLIVSVNFRMSTTASKSDIVLPAAGYYEKSGIKYAQSYLPYVVVGEKAVEPLGEAKSEWEIFGLLARHIQQRATERQVQTYRDALGHERDLKQLERLWSRDGAFPVEDETRALDHIVENSAPTRGLSWRNVAEQGAVRIQAPGRYGPVNGVCSDVADGDSVSPSQWFVERKEPWPTLTGRQQFYLDHPWFLAAGEGLPVFKPPPRIGGPYPLWLTGGHTRWSIHAIWRDEEHMLRLQRGVPVAYLSVEDAAARGVQDHALIRLYNDAGDCYVRAKLSPAVQPGQVILYHAWEPYQFQEWRSGQEPVLSPIKPLHLVGEYGQLHYRTGGNAPGYCPRGTAVQVELVGRTARTP